MSEIKKGISLFWEIYNATAKEASDIIRKHKSNIVLSTYFDCITNPLLTFGGKIPSTKSMIFFGYPKENYLEERFYLFLENLLPKFTSNSLRGDEAEKEISYFLKSCHGGETIDGGMPEHFFYSTLLSKVSYVDYSDIYSVYPEYYRELPIRHYTRSPLSEADITFPCIVEPMPYGLPIFMVKQKAYVYILDSNGRGIPELDWLLPLIKSHSSSFMSNAVLTPKWEEDDAEFFKNRKDKWNWMLDSGKFPKEEVKLYISDYQEMPLHSTFVPPKGLLKTFKENGLSCFSSKREEIRKSSELSAILERIVRRGQEGAYIGAKNGVIVLPRIRDVGFVLSDKSILMEKEGMSKVCMESDVGSVVKKVLNYVTTEEKVTQRHIAQAVR